MIYGTLTRKFHHSALLLIITLFAAGCADSGSKPETLVSGGYDEQAMDKAIERARSEVDMFIAVYEAGDADYFSVKAPIVDGEHTEHFWISLESFDGIHFHGTISNEPGLVKNVAYGQDYKIAKGEISDWMFTRGGMIHGGYTIDPLLPTMDPTEADALRATLVR